MKDIITKISALWATIGTLLITLGIQGPDWLPVIFGDQFTSLLLVAIGAVIDFYQFARTVFAAKNGDTQALAKKNYWNPFRLP